MAHEKIHLNLTREWALAEAKREPEGGILSAGGLALRAASLRPASVELKRSPAAVSASRFFKRLGDIGFPKDFVLNRLVRRDVAAAFQRDAGEAFDRVALDVLDAAERVFQWSPSMVLGDALPAVDNRVLGQARFKVSASADERGVSVYAFYAHYLALLLLKATEGLPAKAIPTDPDEARNAIIEGYGDVSLRSALHYCWDLGVPVLPLSDPAAFHGAFWRVGGRNVIVLKQRTRSLARWTFDLLHELRHAGEEPQAPERAIVEAPETSNERRESDEEQEASWFAGEVILHGQAEDLVKRCVDLTGGQIPRFKRVVPEVAAAARVSVDALANYMAFRLSLQGKDWWGAAVNLQPKAEEPCEIARAVLLERLDLSRLAGPDRDLFQQALEDTAE